MASLMISPIAVKLCKSKCKDTNKIGHGIKNVYGSPFPHLAGRGFLFNITGKTTTVNQVFKLPSLTPLLLLPYSSPTKPLIL